MALPDAEDRPVSGTDHPLNSFRGAPISKTDKTSIATTPEAQFGTFRFWSGVLAAMLVAFVVHLVFNLAGIGIGLAVLAPAPADTVSPATFTVALGLWWVLSAMLSMFIAGVILGKLAAIADWSDAFLHGGLVWALGVLMAAWFATTAIGGALGGAFGYLLAQRPAAPQQVRIDLKLPSAADPSGAGSTVSLPAEPRNRAAERTLRALAWMAVLEAARELQDPRTRRAIHRVAVAVWQDASDRAGELERLIDNWLNTNGDPDSTAARELEAFLEEVLLLASTTARRVIEGWRKKLADPPPAPRSGTEPGATAGAKAEAGTEAEAGSAAEVTAEARRRALSRELSRSVEEVVATLRTVFSEGGALSPAERTEAIASLRRAFEVGRDEAAEILSAWESQVRDALHSLDRALAQGEAALERTAGNLARALAEAALWTCLSLVLGLLAAAGGAMVGGRVLRVAA